VQVAKQSDKPGLVGLDNKHGRFLIRAEDGGLQRAVRPYIVIRRPPRDLDFINLLFVHADPASLRREFPADVHPTRTQKSAHHMKM
jgi:hypothetical protein